MLPTCPLEFLSSALTSLAEAISTIATANHITEMDDTLANPVEYLLLSSGFAIGAAMLLVQVDPMTSLYGAPWRVGDLKRGCGSG